MIVGSGTMWAEDETTIAEFTASTYNNETTHTWLVSNADYATAGGGYYKLVSSDASIVTPSINWSNYENITITISARKFGGPDTTQGKISVSQGTTELNSYSPSSTSIVASSALSISPTNGTITISCPGASSSKGCGVQSIVIKGTEKGGDQPTTFTVTYDANGATSGSVPTDNNKYEEGNEVTVLDNTGELAKTGCAFNGWNTQANGEGTSYNAGETFSISANTTLYAKWTPYTITSQSNNESYGTVSLSGNVITGSPNTGYRYADPAYTVAPENSATVVQDGNTFTVTPTANTTITINFEAIPTHTATFSVNGTTTTTDFQEGAAITFPANPTDIDGKSFVGWTATAINGITNTAPDFVTSATMGNDDITYYAVFAEVTPGTSTSITDHLTTSTFGSPTNYTSWTNKTAANGSDAVYAGNSSTYSNTAIQLRSNNSNSGIVTTASGGKAKKVTVTWNSGTTTGRTLDIYGKNTAYSAASDLYGNASGTKIGSIVFDGESTELTISGDYEFIGLRSNSGAMYINQIDIDWETGTPDTYSGYCTTVAADTREEAGLGFVESTVIVEWYNAAQYTGQALTNPHSVSPITWTSSNEGVATVENGTVTVLALGETTIKASFDGDNNYKKGEASYTLTVKDSRLEPTVTIHDTFITHTNVFEGTAAGKLTASVTYNDAAIEGATVTWSGDNDAVATINATSGSVDLVAAGTVTFTAAYAGNADYSAKTATYEMTVTYSDPNAPGTENNPYTVAEARAAIDAGTGITGVYATGIVSEIVTAFNSQYGNITYNISADGLTTSDQLQAYRGKSYNGDAFTSADDIRVGDVVVIYGTLQKYGSTYEFGEGNQLVSLERPSVPAIIVADATINVNASSQSITRGITVNNLTISDADNFHIKYYNANDEEISDPDWIEATVTVENSAYVLSCTVAANDVEARTAYLKVYAMNGDETIYSNLVTITQAKFVKTTTYTLAHAITPGKHYVIASGDVGTVYVMGKQKSTNRDAVYGAEVNFSEVLSVTEDIAADVREFIISKDGNYYTIFDESKSGYLYASSTSDNHLKTQATNNANGQWTITIDEEGVATLKANMTGRNWMRFNNGNSKLFSCYGENSSQQDIYLFEKDNDEGSLVIPIAAACTDGTNCFGTFSSTKPFVVPENLTVSEIGIDTDGTMNVENYETGAVVPANTGVMVSAAIGDRSYVANVSTEVGNNVLNGDNRLRPTGDNSLTATEMTSAEPETCKFYRLTMHDGTKLGFWWGADGGQSFDIAANKAYLAVPASVAGARNGFAFGDDATGISQIENGKLKIENYYDLQGRKVSKPGKGLYIVNGKKVVIK